MGDLVLPGEHWGLSAPKPLTRGDPPLDLLLAIKLEMFSDKQRLLRRDTRNRRLLA